MTTTVHSIDVSLIHETDQVRTRNGFDRKSLDDLAASIRRLGVMQPVTLCRSNDAYCVVTGHRRVAAARLAGLQAVPAIVAEDPFERLTEVQLAENIHREGLALADQADALRKMAEQSDYVTDGIPLHTRVGKSKAWVSKRLAITSSRFPAELRELVEAGAIEDVEIVGAMQKLRGLPDSAVAFSRVTAQAKAGTLTREGARLARGSLYPIDRRAAGPSVVFIVEVRVTVLRDGREHWSYDSEHRNYNFADMRASKIARNNGTISRIRPSVKYL